MPFFAAASTPQPLPPRPRCASLPASPDALRDTTPQPRGSRPPPSRLTTVPPSSTPLPARPRNPRGSDARSVAPPTLRLEIVRWRTSPCSCASPSASFPSSPSSSDRRAADRSTTEPRERKKYAARGSPAENPSYPRESASAAPSTRRGSAETTARGNSRGAGANAVSPPPRGSTGRT